MRGMIPGLANPHPLGLALPAVYHEDGLAQRFMSAFDEILAPILSTLDNFDAYLDPELSPSDFLPWLAGWVGLEMDGNWSEEQQRRLVATAVELARWRGTRRGIVALVRTYADVEEDAVEVTESGGAAWSPVPGSDVPGAAAPTMTVRVAVDDPGRVDATRLDRLVAMAKPAHVAHKVEVVSS